MSLVTEAADAIGRAIETIESLQSELADAQYRADKAEWMLDEFMHNARSYTGPAAGYAQYWAVVRESLIAAWIEHKETT